MPCNGSPSQDYFGKIDLFSSAADALDCYLACFSVAARQTESGWYGTLDSNHWRVELALLCDSGIALRCRI